jgi:large subunit ribosomal protein L11
MQSHRSERAFRIVAVAGAVAGSAERPPKTTLKTAAAVSSDMAGTIEVLVPGGEADPGPPLGPELGPTPVDVQAVVREINDRTEAFDGTEVPVTVSYEDDGSFDIEVGVPPTAALIKDEAGFETGSGRPQDEFVADLSIEQLKTIAEQKRPDLLAYDPKNAAKEVAGTCVSLGVTIEGEDARTFNERLENGEFDDVFDEAEAAA